MGDAVYRIRFHGRGGQGIKTAGRILGSALFKAGFEVQDAPVYGAERRGAPMVAYVRAAHQPILERGVITRPDLVVVADDTLIPVPAAGVLLGVTPRTVLLIHSPTPPDVWRQRLGLAGPVLQVPLSVRARPDLPIPYASAACVGAAARLLGCIPRAVLEDAIRDELRDVPSPLLQSDLDVALAAFDAMEPWAGTVSEGGEINATEYARPGWIDLLPEHARIAAPDIRAPLTSVRVKTGVWRTLRPVIDPARCRQCTWVCSTLCPDSAILVTAERRPAIDYDHCKGCLICMAVCPHHAIEAVPERSSAEVSA